MRNTSLKFRLVGLAAIALTSSAVCAETVSPADAQILEELRFQRVHRILQDLEQRRFFERGDVDREVEKLRAEGPEALPILAEEFPRLYRLGAKVAAELLGESCYRPALSPLLSALVRPLSELSVIEREPAKAVVDSLRKLAGPDDVAQISAKLFDPKLVRLHPFFIELLAKIDSREAYSVLRTFYGRDLSPRRRWFTPRDPERLLEHTSCEDLAAALERARESQDTVACAPQTAVVLVSRSQGGAWIVFRDEFLGSIGDLWVAEVLADGLSPAVFLGNPSLEQAGEEVFDAQLEAWFDGQNLKARWSSSPRAVLEVDLRSAAADTDGDGLPDLVEERLHLDPRRTDTDGDGLADAEDMTPTGRTPRSRSTGEEILWAILRHVYSDPLLADGRRRPPRLEADVEIDGPVGRALTVSSGQRTRRTVPEIAELLNLHLKSGWGRTGELTLGGPAAGEIRYELDSGVVGYRIALRKYKDLWVVVFYELGWVV